MCTVVLDGRTRAGAAEADDAVRILAIRDELTARDFDDPGEWWAEHPGVVGGRDREAGGSWCVSDVVSGRTALVLNRPEKHTGTPSRGLLPLAALEHGEAWTGAVDHREMAAFNLLLVGPDVRLAWAWDGADLTVRDLDAGPHFTTPHGVDPGDARSERYAARFVAESGRAAWETWPTVVGGESPEDDASALLVRHVADGGEVYASVLAQQIDAVPGRLEVSWTRTPWRADTWQTSVFTAAETTRSGS